MNNTTTRTPTRYSLGSTPTTIVGTGPDGQTIVVAVTETLGATHSYGQMCADARYIVRACNSHESLVAALRKIADNARLASSGDAFAWSMELADIERDARAALAATEAA